MIAVDTGDELVVSGEKIFSTGGVISDVTVLEGVLSGSDDVHVFAYVLTKQARITFKGDWDMIGQRLTVSPDSLKPIIRNLAAA